jgi:hypothetical protein
VVLLCYVLPAFAEVGMLHCISLRYSWQGVQVAERRLCGWRAVVVMVVMVCKALCVLIDTCQTWQAVQTQGQSSAHRLAATKWWNVLAMWVCL